MADVKKSIQLMFDRPGEPLISPKGTGNKNVFQLTEQFLPDNFKNNGIELNNRFGDEVEVRIPLKNLGRVPKFPNAEKLDKFSDLCLFNPYHRKMTAEVIDALMGVPEGDLQTFLSTCAYARCKLNCQLVNYAMSVAILHRRDTRDIQIPNLVETFPAKFLDSKVLPDAREAATIADAARTTTDPIVVPRDYTASDLETEHKLAYFREDIGVNLHHWHWHLVYPFQANDMRIVNKDRRGELFYYMHQQIIARYNTERLCNGLALVNKFSNFREPIVEAYFPKLDSLTSARGYPPRQANMRWRDINRPIDGLQRSISDIERWRRNIEEAIAQGRVRTTDGNTKALDIDTLGNMIESSILSPNRELYGDLHNTVAYNIISLPTNVDLAGRYCFSDIHDTGGQRINESSLGNVYDITGHVFTAYIHDPDHRFLETNGVMADEAITMRDPFFYRWHGFIDDLFQKFKESSAVRAYTNSELENPGVRISGVSITSDGARGSNEINTFWMQSDVDMARGLDFSYRAPVYVRFTHLNHRDFTYNIQVNNTGSARRATVRIFLAPSQSERGSGWRFSDHRKMFVELDRFVTPISAGMNNITRRSAQSSVTIPFEQTFRDLSVQGENPRQETLTSFNFCGCGWPQHMLVPKGTEGGMQFQLFVMLSNWELDKIDQPDGTQMTCDDASSFCGIQDQLYPDKRSMGFPFDRPSTAQTVQDFLRPNMFVTPITIRHTNNTVANPRNPNNVRK